MELDDEVVVIIVGDEDESRDGSYFPPIEIKQEILDETDGTFTAPDASEDTVIIKEEILDEEENYLNDDFFAEFDPDNVKIEEEDEDYVPSDSEDEKKRYKLLRPCQRRSFVQELREQYSELAEDEELLINSLVEVMRNVKPPPLPDHFRVNGIMLECIVCGRITETIPAAGRHYQEKHGPRYLICFACGVDFRSTTNLYKHEKRCNGPDATIVLQARAIAVGNKGRHRPFLQAKNYRPRNSLHGPTPTKKGYACSSCPAVFYSKCALESHVNLHTGLRPFKCEQCASAYTSRSALARHRKKHSDVQYICDHCNRPFNVKTTLVTHLDTHLPFRKHGCEECGRRFAQKSALLLHVDGKHRNLPPPCACQLCPKRFRRMTLLKAHMKKDHGMLLMTRKMFFKKLPTMTDTQLQQAKVIMKSDEAYIEAQHPDPENVDVNEEFLSYIREHCVFNQSDSEVNEKSEVLQNSELKKNLETNRS